MTVLVANEDIELGEPVTPDKVDGRSRSTPKPSSAPALTSPSQLQGQPALLAVPEGAQVTGEVDRLGGQDGSSTSPRS